MSRGSRVERVTGRRSRIEERGMKERASLFAAFRLPPERGEGRGTRFGGKTSVEMAGR